jgi:CMP/dCMP kinase
MKIAIDGPAASGKSTLGAELARRLGYLYFDTGVMYRTVTLAVLQRAVDIRDEVSVNVIAQEIKIEVTAPTVDDGRQYSVFLADKDVTWQLRSKDIDANVSIPSAYADVRKEMVSQQRRIAERGNVVMVGRDIGTVVLPDADIKIYLDATVEERARRRHKELLERGESSDYEQVLAAMRTRDLIDSSRTASPLKPAADAFVIDSTHLSVEDIIQRIDALISTRQRDVVKSSHPQ